VTTSRLTATRTVAGVTPTGAKLDGVDLLPYLTGKNTGAPHEALYWRFGDQTAIRKGDWKLVRGPGPSAQPELFNLKDDTSESKNLAMANPEKLAELTANWNDWNKEQAPLNAPKEKPAKKKQKAKKKADPPGVAVQPDVEG